MTVPLRAPEPIVVAVALGPRAYDIAIGRGLLASLGQRIKDLRPGARVAIVTDETVARLHLNATESALKTAGIDSGRIVVSAGRGFEELCNIRNVCEAIIAARIERNDLVLALGGGVIGDLAGFAAACSTARARFRAGTNDAACTSRFLGRRQDGHQFAARAKI